LNLIILFLSALVLVYLIPSSFNKILFPLYCVLFYKSKNNALWLVFFLLLIEGPGGLFSGGDRSDLLRLPLYNLAEGVSISFEQLFCITAFLKVFKKKVRFKPLGFISKNMKYLAVYFIVLLFVSFLLGISFSNLRFVYRIIINLTLFYSIYFLFSDENDFIDFFKLIFPLAFVAFSLQLYSLVNGHQLITLFKPESLFIQGSVGLYEIRPIEMVHIVMFAFFGSLYFLFLKKKVFNQAFLLVVNVIAFASIFITGTRTWFIAFFVTYLFLFIFMPKKLFRITLKHSIVLVGAIIMLFSSVLIKNQFSNAFKRISTVELIAKGDITMGGTADRFNVKAPIVMKAFGQSTIIFGAGFSDMYFTEGTGHVGYQNLLLNSGIIGFILVLLFLVQIIRSGIKMKYLLGNYNNYKDAMIIFVFWLIAILIINASTQMIGYDLPLVRIILLCMFVYFFNNQAKNAMKYSIEKAL